MIKVLSRHLKDSIPHGPFCNIAVTERTLDVLVMLEIRNTCFSENLACFVFLKNSFSDWPFCLITDDLSISENSACVCFSKDL